MKGLCCKNLLILIGHIKRGGKTMNLIHKPENMMLLLEDNNKRKMEDEGNKGTLS